MNLTPCQLELKPAVDRIQALLNTAAIRHDYPHPDQAANVLDTPAPPAEGVWRAADGRALIVCKTDMPDVTPAMIDWWFGWHLPSSARYRLWHPKAHISARVKEDRSHLKDDRARYLNNESYVDEYIGKQLKKLAIKFVPPAQFGLHNLDQRGATAICAVTADRLLHSDGGHLVHLILPTPNGCQMRSGFWLGEINSGIPLLKGVVNRIGNTRTLRNLIVSDRMCLDLLQHCSEEMAHLASFLPALYARQNPHV